MKSVDVNPRMSIRFNKENNKEDPKFKVGNHVRISKYKNIFVKDYVPNWSEEVLVITKVKNIVPWIYAISNLKSEEIVASFTKKSCKKQIKKSFRVEKVIKRKISKLYVKWKGYYNLFNSWIDKKTCINESIFSIT